MLRPKFIEATNYMLLEKPFDLQKVIEFTGASAAMILDDKGNLINSINIKFEENIAAMLEMAFSMTNDLVEDMDFGNLEQLVAKTSTGFLITNKMSSNYILSVLCKDHNKLGLFLNKINAIEF